LNLGQIKTKAIQIIRAYSNGGSLVGSGENSDYILSMNSFINDAQFDLSSIRPIVKTYKFPTLPDSQTQALKRFKMPSDFAGFKELKNGDFQFTSFDWEGKTMIIPVSYTGDFALWYYAFPAVYDATTPDSTELDIDLDLQQVIPYYVAGHVIIDENPSLAEFFLNEYNSKKNRQTVPKAITIENVFGW
jgi:hypothetical protein